MKNHLSTKCLLQNIADTCDDLVFYLAYKFAIKNRVEAFILVDFLLEEYIQIIESNTLLQEQINRQINYIRDRLATTKLAEENPSDEVN